MVVKLTFVKMGVIGSSLIIDILLDERASRKDLQIRTISSGCNMNPSEVIIVDKALEFDTDVFILVSPAASMEGPSEARKKLQASGKPVIVVTDIGGKKIKDIAEEDDSFGYIVVNMDPMIGARQQYLDPTEMVLFNGLLLTCFACTGVVRKFQKILNDIVEQVKSGKVEKLPKITITPTSAAIAGNFSNPYARAKAEAANQILMRIPTVTKKGTWKEKDPAKATLLCATGHEMLQTASDLAQTAREMEKSQDTVLRLVHNKDGSVSTKTKLLEKPQKND